MQVISDFSIDAPTNQLLLDRGLTAKVDRFPNGLAIDYAVTIFDATYTPIELLKGRIPSINHQFDRFINCLRHAT